MKFIIPSFQRSEILQAKTLKYLDVMGVDRSDVYVFIREDDTDYQGYANIQGINLLPIDIKGIGMTHNYITEHFEADEFIVEIDDDLENIVDQTRKPIEDFLGLCDLMKSKMEEVGASYGGTYAVANPLFMSKCEEFTTDLRYCLGCLRFRFIRKDIKVKTNYAEDMENCILHFIRDKKILKNNWIAPKTKNYADGGCNGDGRAFESEQKDKKYLADKYPLYCRYFERKNGKPDCRVREYKDSIRKETFKKL
tara:strand:- start:409 stop:1164 length:756 start_codon:yes stop_codon:yes gene_type:complete